jgi:hypothetical protein
MKNRLAFAFFISPALVLGQTAISQKPNSGIIIENSFSNISGRSSVGSPFYNNLNLGFYKFFSLKGAFQARLPFLRTEVVVGRRQGDFYNTITTEKEKIAATNLDVNVILPIRWPIGENIFFNFGAGLQTGVAYTSVFSNATTANQLLRTSINPSFGLLSDFNLSFGGRTNACVGMRILATNSTYSYSVNSFYFGFSIPKIPRKKE